MNIRKYEEMSMIQRDAIREVGSIGTAYAATALSELLSHPVNMTVPDIRILGYNEAIKAIGEPEEIVTGILVRMSGEMKGVMLCIQKVELINIILQHMLNKDLTDITSLGDIEKSALVEIGNIMISSYMNAISSLTGITIDLSVPGISINMLGGILSVPMVELAYQTDKIMTIEGKFVYENRKLDSNLLMVPEVDSLNYLLEKLGVANR